MRVRICSLSLASCSDSSSYCSMMAKNQSICFFVLLTCSSFSLASSSTLPLASLASLSSTSTLPLAAFSSSSRRSKLKVILSLSLSNLVMSCMQSSSIWVSSSFCFCREISSLDLRMFLSQSREARRWWFCSISCECCSQKFYFEGYLSQRQRVNWLIELFSSYYMELSASIISVCSYRLIESLWHCGLVANWLPAGLSILPFTAALVSSLRVGLTCLGLTYWRTCSSGSVLRWARMVSSTVTYETFGLFWTFFLNLQAHWEDEMLLLAGQWFSVVWVLRCF